MLASLVKGTDWSQLTEYLSPVLFQIVPPLKMTNKIRTLVSGYLSPSKFATARSTVAIALSKSNLGIVLGEAASKPNPERSTHDSTEISRGDVVLRLYFWQLFNLDVALLDLRHRTFATGENPLIWQPAPLFNHWDENFLAAVRDMYLGFYNDRHDIMDAALRQLGLYAAKDTFLAHFGDNQEQVRFDLAQFRATFHEVFLVCKQSKSQIHPDFLALGGMLACLYEHLEQLGETFNVKAAFNAVVSTGRR